MKKIYESRIPGLTVILPVEEQKKFEKLNNGKPLKFPSANPIFETENEDLQKIIEECNEFKRGNIVNLPTPEQLELLQREKRRKEVKETLARIPGAEVTDDQIEAALDAEFSGESVDDTRARLEAEKADAVKKKKAESLKKAREEKKRKSAAAKNADSDGIVQGPIPEETDKAVDSTEK